MEHAVFYSHSYNQTSHKEHISVFEIWCTNFLRAEDASQGEQDQRKESSNGEIHNFGYPVTSHYQNTVRATALLKRNVRIILDHLLLLLLLV